MIELLSEGQFGMDPERPLIVWASETFGANPDLRAALITFSVSDFHHSAIQFKNKSVSKGEGEGNERLS